MKKEETLSKHCAKLSPSYGLLLRLPMKYQLSEEDIQNYLDFAKQNLPRHTSYPAAPFWQKDYALENVKGALKTLKENDEPLSLYFHIPYCRQLCFYCGCTKEIYPDERIQKQDPRSTLLAGIFKDIEFYGKQLEGNTVEQIHFGGGTPTFLKPEHFEEIFKAIHKHFKVASKSEIATEIDPRVTTYEHLKVLKDLGCNRLSMGIQDFSLKVQKAVNRIQSFELVKKSMEQARSLGYDSINFDLIYGLPFQTVESMRDSIEKTIELSADRIAFYRLALIPELFKWQKSFVRSDLPSERENIEIFLSALNLFTEKGYDFIGLDHFAKKEEMLSEALQERSIRRNFQGMSTGKSLSIIGMGPSAVSTVKGYFWQNKRTAKEWLASLEGEDRYEKGMTLSQDDLIRQDFLQELYCYGDMDWERFGKRWSIEARQYFEESIEKLKFFSEKGLLHIKESGFELTPILGRLLVRLIASVFDPYLQEEKKEKRVKFSQLG